MKSFSLSLAHLQLNIIWAKKTGKLVVYRSVNEPGGYLAEISQGKEENILMVSLVLETKNIEIVETKRDGIFQRYWPRSNLCWLNIFSSSKVQHSH